MKDAMEKAEDNRSRNLDTVVFFDEANTTDAIGLIKEIMCDRRLHGKPIPEDLKFIAACNPYRRSEHDHIMTCTDVWHVIMYTCAFGFRHDEKMIEKLHSAGLGFCVRETETQQKLGR